MILRTIASVFLIAASGISMAAEAADFRYHPPGVFVPGQQGTGRAGDRAIYAPDIVFPLRFEATSERVVANTQVYAPRPQCLAQNHAMPWGDTYCEKRAWSMPLCPGGKGHQGVDIRPVRCEDNRTLAVAVEDGVIRKVTRSTNVELRGDSGVTWRYLHVHPASIQVRAGQRVRQGDPIANVSNYMEGRPNTSIHLHLDAQGNVPDGVGARTVFLPIYASLVDAYRKAIGLPSLNEGGKLSVDPQREIGAPGDS